MSLIPEAIAAVVKKVMDYVPGRAESIENKIQRLIDENYRLAQETPLSAKSAGRMSDNTITIRRLRESLSRASKS